MSELKIANRYSQALMQQSMELKNTSEIFVQMQHIEKVCNENKSLLNVLKNPIISGNEKLKALNAIFNGSNPLILNLFNLLCLKRRENQLLNIAHSFIQLYRVNQGIEKVTVESAIALDKNTLDQIEAYTKQQTGAKQVDITNTINPSVIGGMVIKFGDNLLDTSIAAKIRKIKKELNIA